MTVPLLTVGSSLLCPHGGSVSVSPSQTKVLANGEPVVTFADSHMIAGCPFQLPPTPTPDPCLTIQWLVPATKVLVDGQPALLQTSSGLCKGSLPQGPPNVVAVQSKVLGV